MNALNDSVFTAWKHTDTKEKLNNKYQQVLKSVILWISEPPIKRDTMKHALTRKI